MASGCSFSKDPKTPQSTTVLLQESVKSPVSLDEVLINNDPNLIFAALDKRTPQDLRNYKTSDGLSLMDVAAKLKFEDLVKYLMQRDVSPFQFNLAESLNFLEKFQKQELDAVVASSRRSVDFALTSIQEKHLERHACLPVLQALFQDRWTKNSDINEEPILKLLKYPLCSQALQNSSTDQKKNLFSNEFLFQYHQDFENYSLISTLSISLQIERSSVYDVDPELILNLKQKCLSKDHFKLWQKFVSTPYKFKRMNYKYRVLNSDDIMFRNGLQEIRQLEVEDREKLYDLARQLSDENSATLKVIRTNLGLPEDDVCSK